MNYMARVKYVLRDGFRLVGRHAGMSFLTIFTAMTVFFIIGSTAMFLLNLNNLISTMEGQVSISAYVKEEADINAVFDKIKKIEYVNEAEIITKDMALERLRSRIGSQSKAITLLGKNPLPPSIKIKVKSSDRVTDVVRDLVLVREIDDIVYPGHVAEKLAKLSAFTKKFSLFLLVIAVATSAVVLFNTIRISVYSREEEINVMLRVGATTTYVAMPFVIHGFILGLLGSLLASALVVFSYYSAIDYLREMLPFVPLLDSPHITFKLVAVLVLSGTAVSLISSLFAVDGFIRKAMRPI